MKALFLIIVLVLAVGCSKGGPKTKTNFEISIGAVTGTNFPGGVVLRVQEVGGSRIQEHQISTYPYAVDVPQGTWNFYVVGFEGNSAWDGNTKCGKALNVPIAGSEASVTITSSKTECTNIGTYSTLAATVGAAIGVKWDEASTVWNNSQTTWGP